MAEGIQKAYVSAGGFVPAFDLDPSTGLAALDVNFEDQSFTNDIIIQKSYTSDPGVETIQKVYL